MDEYVTRVEYDEHSKRMEDEHRRMNHRIAELEEREKENNKLLLSIERMATNMENMQKELISLSKRLVVLEEQDGKKWRNAKGKVFDIVIGAVAGFLIAGIIYASVKAF